jgi:hypothetical protein
MSVLECEVHIDDLSRFPDGSLARSCRFRMSVVTVSIGGRADVPQTIAERPLMTARSRHRLLVLTNLHRHGENLILRQLTRASTSLFPPTAGSSMTSSVVFSTFQISSVGAGHSSPNKAINFGMSYQSSNAA